MEGQIECTFVFDTPIRAQHRAIWEAIRDHDGQSIASPATAPMRYVLIPNGLSPEDEDV